MLLGDTDDDALRRFLTAAGWAADGATREIGPEDESVRLKQVRLHASLAESLSSGRPREACHQRSGRSRPVAVINTPSSRTVGRDRLVVPHQADLQAVFGRHDLVTVKPSGIPLRGIGFSAAASSACAAKSGRFTPATAILASLSVMVCSLALSRGKPLITASTSRRTTVVLTTISTRPSPPYASGAPAREESFA